MRCVIEDCEDCSIEKTEKVYQGHECGELCDIEATNRRRSPDWHRRSHEPMRCRSCGTVVGTRAYTVREGLVDGICARGCCTVITCRYCGAEWCSFGPIRCGYCNPTGARWRPDRVKRIHQQYAARR